MREFLASLTVFALAFALSLAGPMGQPGRPACVAAGTEVATPDGSVAVESLEAGQRVIARDSQGEERERPVLANPSRESTRWLEVRLEDGTWLKVTRDHLVATRNGWRRASDLRAGDGLVTRAGQTPIERIDAQSGRIQVYDPDVAGDNTYFANGILVHNKDSADDIERMQTTLLGP